MHADYKAQDQTASCLAEVDSIDASTVNATGPQVLCSNEQETRRPCACCKIQCWHDVQRVNALLLGHAPGADGDDQEAVDTLIGIRKCASQNCAGLCALEKMLYPRRLIFRRRR
uniref:Uncharacterized protein n=1 Tax=Romanomermis culicivorax TaxID=13658 RepID=A0A915K2L3_ROMCU